MKFLTFILSAYLIAILFFAGVAATVAVVVAIIIIFAIDVAYGLFAKDRPYFDSEDIGREVKPYVRRIGITEILIVVICAALLFTCYIILP